MKQYLDLMRDVYNTGVMVGDRTGVGRKRKFGYQLRFNMRDGFPLVTTKKINPTAIFQELLWFIRGSTNADELSNQGVKIWDQWKVTDADVRAFVAKWHTEETPEEQAVLVGEYLQIFKGSIGALYGSQWRSAESSQYQHNLKPLVPYDEIASDKIAYLKEVYKVYLSHLEDTNKELRSAAKEPIAVMDFKDYCVNANAQAVDQLQQLLVNLKKRPYSSRHIVSAWAAANVADEALSPQENVMFGNGALAACHAWMQWFVEPSEGKDKLSVQVYVRSNDLPVGAPYNIAEYALLLHMVAQVTDLEPYELVYTIGDAHIYANQLDKAATQLGREPYPLCTLKLNTEVKDLYQFTIADIKLDDYQHHPFIQYPVS